MKLLQKSELHLVKPKFQQMVLDAWKRKESVPYGVIHLSDVPVTRREIKRAKEIVKQFNLNEN